LFTVYLKIIGRDIFIFLPIILHEFVLYKKQAAKVQQHTNTTYTTEQDESQ